MTVSLPSTLLASDCTSTGVLLCIRVPAPPATVDVRKLSNISEPDAMFVNEARKDPVKQF